MLKDKGKKSGDYPVVVIGSGIGGLASAVYLSRAGFPVTVIEQHNVPGGYEPWRRFAKDYFAGNKEEYNREKERIARTLIKRVEEKVIPGLSSMIKVMEAATPLTNIRFIKNPEGAIFGYPNSMDNSYMNRGTKNTTPIKGLFLSSGWGSRSGSYTGGIMNGREVSRLIMKEI